MADLRDVTVGIKTFYRKEKLKIALKSLIGLDVREVIVADDGPKDPDKEQLYNSMSEYLPLRVLRLPYDSGLAYGRNRIVENTKTPYLLIIDDDMEIPNKNSILFLKQILIDDKTIGGVGAFLIENGRIRSGAHNLIYKKGYIIRNVPDRVEIKFSNGIPYMIFDQILNATLFRTTCLRDYPWDKYYKINFEHLDFYWGHKQLGKWRFAVTPAVLFKHCPGGDKIYRKFRFNRERYNRSKEYFLRKWKLKGVINIQTNFLNQNYPLKSFLWLWIKKHAPFRLLPYLMKIEENWPFR